MGGCEAELRECLVARTIPPDTLTRAIAVAKIRAVETSIALCHALKQEVGSYALMWNTGFENTDFLQCCKFAEGDSRILMQKMARDRLKLEASAGGNGNAAEAALCARIGAGMAAAAKEGAGRKEAWDAQWVEVYELAELVMQRNVAAYTDSSGTK